MAGDLKATPEHYKGQNIDLMLIHLGGTMLPSPSLPLLMVTIDARQGLELVKLIYPDLTIPIHYKQISHLAIATSICPSSVGSAGGATVITMSSCRRYRTSKPKWKRQGRVSR